MAQVAVISDLHLGSGGRTDSFGHDDAEFLRFLRHLENNFERIVLLGDIWETLTAATPGAQLTELCRAQTYHREIHERFLRPKYRYVFGNHDLVAGRHQGASEEFAIEDRGMRILFSHGHQGDSLCAHARWISEMGVWAGAWLRRLGLAPVYAYFAGMERQRARALDRCVVRRWAVSEAESRAADIVVTGHTHVPAKAEDGHCLFLNSGTCAEGEISFLSLDTARGEYQVHASY